MLVLATVFRGCPTGRWGSSTAPTSSGLDFGGRPTGFFTTAAAEAGSGNLGGRPRRFCCSYIEQGEYSTANSK